MSDSANLLLSYLRRLGEGQGLEDPSPAVLKRTMRILGSSIAGDRPDGLQTVAGIKSRLVQSSHDGTGTSKALRFTELHNTLLRLNATRQTTAILHLLSELGDANEQQPQYRVAAAFRAPVLNFSSEPSSLPPTSTHAPSQGGFYGRDNSNAPSPVRSVRSSLDGRYSEQGGGGYGMGGMRGNGRSGHGGGGSNYGGGGSGSVQGRERQLAAPNGMPRRSYGVSSSAASSSSAVGVGMVGVGTTWSEAELLRDVLYAFQGIDGTCVKFSVELGGFVVDPALQLPPNVKDLVSQLCEMGWLFNKVSSFVKSASVRTSGLMGAAFSASLEEDLSDYYRLIAVLETQLQASSSSQDGGSDGSGGLTLRRLAVWAQDPLERLQLMAVLVDSVGIGSLRGGNLASGLHTHLKHGDPLVKALVSKTLRRVCAPLTDMVSAWVHEGELADPHHEFFVTDASTLASSSSSTSGLCGVASSSTLTASSSSSSSSTADLWRGRHVLDPSLVPSFLPLELAQQVLVLGKSLHFMRRACGDAQWVQGAIHKHSTSGGGYLGTSASPSGDGTTNNKASSKSSTNVAEAWVGELRSLVESIGSATHARLLNLMENKFGLRTHLAALKKFLLLGQGDFVVGLMDALAMELDKPADEIYHHSLTSVLDGTLRTFAPNEQSAVLERLGVRLLKASPEDRGWEIFSLDYKVDAPLNAVVGPKQLRSYRQVFHLLWRLKRGDFVLSSCWRQHMSAAKARLPQRLPKLAKHLHEANLVRNNMWHLVQNLSNYMMFEVLETSWRALIGQLDTAATLDHIILAHDQYLATIKHKALLTSDLADVVEQLHCVLDTVLAFGAASDTLLTDSMVELSRLDARQKALDEKMAAGEWANDEDYQNDDDHEDWGEERVSGVSLRTLDRLKVLGANFSTAFAQLVLLLRESSSGSEVLRFLVFRLDFNGYNGMA